MTDKVVATATVTKKNNENYDTNFDKYTSANQNASCCLFESYYPIRKPDLWWTADPEAC